MDDEVYVAIIRHGYSCANSAKEYFPLGQFLQSFEHDAKLVKIAERQLDTGNVANKIFSEIGNVIKKETRKNAEFVPLFFTSVLSRTMETAIAFGKGFRCNIQDSGIICDNIPEKFPILPVRYIEEIAIPGRLIFPDYQNIPVNKKKLSNDIKEHMYKVHENVIPSFKQITPYDSNGDPINEPDVYKFMNDVMPYIFDLSGSIIEGGLKKNSVIVIFSHGGTIEKLTRIRLGNIGTVLFKYSKKEKDKKEYKIIFKGFNKKESESQLQKGDLKECKLRYLRPEP